MDGQHDSKPSPTGATSEESPAAILATVWATLGDLFGPMWTSGFGPTPTPAWRAALRGLRSEEVRRGFRAVAEAGGHYPPSAPEFRALCRPPDKRTPEQRALYARIDAEHGGQRAALPAPDALAMRTRVGRQWLAFWWLEGIREKPSNVTMEQLDDMLDGADVAAMREQVARCRREILDGSIHDRKRL